MFDDAIDYIINYFSDKAKADNNETAQRWFSDHADSYDNLIDDIFSTDDDNVKLAELYSNKAKTIQKDEMITRHTRLDAILSLQRDIRTHFAAGNYHDPMTAVDIDRYAHINGLATVMQLKLLQRSLAAKEAK